MMSLEFDDIEERTAEPIPKLPVKRKLFKVIIFGSIGIVLIAAIYFGYPYLSGNIEQSKEKQQMQPPRIIQLDVLNGCGAKGVGSRFTDFLRANGFDVVEMKNYKSFLVNQTLVVDRIGDLSLARRVAAALGVSEKNIIQQINPDYFVDVSVIIGKDFSELKVTH
ncbi:MAG: LytR C-terminal domain-containing protein [Ignavibacteriales bacterium]|nr:LytR C-terminal domain-containing protein [Ignavibacteriales bacterium]